PGYQQPVGFMDNAAGRRQRQLVELQWKVERPNRLPFSSRTIHAPVPSRETSRVLWTASARIKFFGSRPSSSNERTHAVVPIFNAVANGLMFESPMSKWSRRYFR